MSDDIYKKEGDFLKSLLFNYPEYKYELWASDKQYEVFRMIINGNVFIFYPHRTTAGNTHLRVRVQVEKDFDLCQKIVLHIQKDSEKLNTPITVSRKTFLKYVKGQGYKGGYNE